MRYSDSLTDLELRDMLNELDLLEQAYAGAGRCTLSKDDRLNHDGRA